MKSKARLLNQAPFWALFIGVGFAQYWQLLIGPANVDSVRAIICIIELTTIIHFQSTNHHSTRLPKWIIVSFSIWVISTIVSTVLSVRFYFSLITQLEWFTHAVFAFVLAQHLNKQQWDKLITAIPFALVCTAIFYVYRWFTLEDPYTFNWINATPFTNIRQLGYFCTVSAIISQFSYLLCKNTSRKKLWFISCIVSVSFLIWTAGRGAFYSYLLTIILAIIILPNYRSKILTSTFISLLFGFLIAYMGTTDSTAGNINHLSKMSIAVRIGMWIETLQSLSSFKTLLFGYGVNTYQVTCKNFVFMQPHNAIVQALHDWGTIGTVSFLSLIGYILINTLLKIYKKTIESHTQIIAFFAAVSLCLHSLNAGVFYHSYSILVFALCIAYLLPISLNNKQPILTTAYKNLCSGIVILLFCLHLTNTYWLIRPVIPAPNSFTATMVRSFPSTTLIINRWIEAWYKYYPAEAFEWTQWLQTHGDNSWYYYYLEARVRDDIGEQDKAAMLITQAIENAPQRQQQHLIDFQNALKKQM
ncbi:O-antigen ligase family protein [Zooshikella marina]|uniref:O-antigen ligase family protein n=1 Tax=Zooshikella ganghwensis TaxID=202772 RepID=UPI001BAE8CF3|nr:O-antigen ligase family protein [Zooshikella ganghwensis]MBU2708668.1 O-antigen ligase family protein [Zooshikella ganghwensis]